MTEQELRRTAIVIQPRGRAVLCVWAAVPGLLLAPFVFWQSLWAGGVFCAVWAALVFLVRARPLITTEAIDHAIDVLMGDRSLDGFDQAVEPGIPRGDAGF